VSWSESPVPERPPSWTVPILVGALATLTTFGLGLLASQVLPMLGCACCCGSFLPLGAISAWLAAKRAPRLTVGQGFTVAFIAVGAGAVAVAAMATWQILETGVDVTVLEEQLRSMPENAELSDEQIRQFSETVQQVIPYVPVVLAALQALLAGLCGMITVSILQGSRSRDRHPPHGDS